MRWGWHAYHPTVHPPIEPFDHGMLERPDGARLYWEVSGSPTGRPAIYLHGGPGSGLGRGGYRRRFDPSQYLIIGIDQRGCGRSTPWAIDDRDALSTNTTHALIDDMEALREQLTVDRWLVHGVSWGSTLALAYALEHPTRVSELVLTAVTSGSRDEIDWITEGVSRIFPEAWQRFASIARDGERVVEAYARLLTDDDPQVRSQAATAWEAWEATHVSLDPNWMPGPMFETARERENFATLVTRYWANDCFLPTPIRDRVGELSGIPGALIHGRHDISGPAITPWMLHRAWPGSEIHIVETEGHGGEQEMELTSQIIGRFARR